MQRIVLSFILATAMFVSIALPRETSQKVSGTHLQSSEQKENLVFGDGAHKRWKEFAEANPDFGTSYEFR